MLTLFQKNGLSFLVESFSKKKVSKKKTNLMKEGKTQTKDKKEIIKLDILFEKIKK
mgnify:CR=1 FL=1